MPKCPKCAEVIYHLKLYEPAQVQYDLGATIEGEPNFVQREIILIIDAEAEKIVACPRCDKQLFDDAGEAAQWLVGKREWQQPIDPDPQLPEKPCVDGSIAIDNERIRREQEDN